MIEFVTCGARIMPMSAEAANWQLPEPFKPSSTKAPYEMREYFRDKPCMRLLTPEEIEERRQEQLRKEHEERAAMPTLTNAQTVALLKMTSPRRYGSTFARGIATYIERAFKAKPVYADYAALKDLGLCRKAVDSPWHVFTDEGSRCAEIIAKMKAEELDLHMFMEGSGAGPTITFRCMCGKWSATRSRGPNGAKAAYTAYCQHLVQLTPKEAKASG